MKNAKEGIVVLSLFDGMSCGRLGLEAAGVKVAKYMASEIKPYYNIYVTFRLVFPFQNPRYRYFI